MAGFNTDLVKRLSESYGVAGRENDVRDIILSELKGHCDDIKVDAIGNVIAAKRGKQNKNILLTAPMDEVGFIISDIREGGGGAFLNFAPVGKIRPQTIVSESVVVGDKRLDGIISLKAVHLTTKAERENLVKTSDLFIDIGLDKKAELLDSVMLGDCACFKSRFFELGENGLSNKAIGQRACVAILIELLKSDNNVNLTCVFLAQSQVGLRGSKLSIGNNRTDFDEAIVLDSIEQENIELNYGAVIPYLINETCPDREIVKNFIKEADKKKIKYKIIAKKNVDSDITSINIKGKGILSAEIDIPVRNKNVASEVIDKRDVCAVFSLIREHLKQD